MLKPIIPSKEPPRIDDTLLTKESEEDSSVNWVDNLHCSNICKLHQLSFYFNDLQYIFTNIKVEDEDMMMNT